MSLAGGREHVAIPGPSVIPDRVLAAMHRAMPDIYGDELLAVSDEIYAELPRIAGAHSGRVFVTISNGHGAWEMAISNTLSRGDKVLVLESGRFAVTWGEMAAFSGVKTEVLHAPERRASAEGRAANRRGASTAGCERATRRCRPRERRKTRDPPRRG